MSIIDTTLTNTILIPASDGNASSSLAETTIVSDIEKFSNNFQKKSEVLGYQFSVYIKSGDKSVKAAYCQDIKHLGVSRTVEQKRTGGNDAYTVNLPGGLTTEVVTFVHLVTDNEVFLNWLINGLNYGGIQMADIEVRVGDENDYMVYTLRDAFPIKWNFGTMSINLNGIATNDSVVTYSLKQGDVIVEYMDLVYGKLDYSHVGGE